MLCNPKQLSSSVKLIFCLTRWVPTTLRSCSSRFTSAVFTSFHCIPEQKSFLRKLSENMLFDGRRPPVKRASLSSGLALCVTVTLAIFLTTGTWKGKEAPRV